MKVNQYGQHIYNTDDLFYYYMAEPDAQLDSVVVDNKIQFDEYLQLEHQPQLLQWVDPGLTVEEYDAVQQSQWLMPRKYAELDIAQWVLDKCKTQEELQRVGEELLLYQEYEMFPLLRYMVYLVDTMRQHGIVWGVGRGSSVSSYVLFLIGIHRINSMLYDLDIREFLK